MRKMKKDFSEVQLRYDLITDENVKNLLQNSEYRDLILGNENRMKIYREEIIDYQRKMDIKDEHVARL